MVSSNGYYEEAMPTNVMQNLVLSGVLDSNFGGSMITSRKSTYVQSQNIQMIDSRNGANQKTTWQPPRVGYIDMGTIAIAGTVFVSPDTGAYSTGLIHGISDLMNRVVLSTQGNVYIEDVRFYNRIRGNFMWHYNLAQWLTTAGNTLEFIGRATVPSTGQNSPMDASQYFFHTPSLGFLASRNFFPAFAVGNLQIDIYWEDPVVALVSSGPTTMVSNTAYYILTNLRLYYDVVNVKDDAHAQVIATINSELGWQVHYNSYETYDATGISTATFDQNFPVRLGSIKSVFFLAAESANRISSADYLKSQITGLQTCQFRVNNTNFPEDPMMDITTIWREFAKANGCYNARNPGGIVATKPFYATTVAAILITIAQSDNGFFNLPFVPKGLSDTQVNTIFPPLTWGVTPDAPVTLAAGAAAGFNQTIIPAYDFELENNDETIAGLSTNSSAADISVRIQRNVSTQLDAWLVCLCDKTFTIKGLGDSANTRVDK